MHKALNCKCIVVWTLLAVAMLAIPVHAQQNVVLIVLDTCREDCVDDSRGGVPLMPYLSSLPAVRFRNASANAPWTASSMASIYTSRYVDTHQLHTGIDVLPESYETIAEYFKSAGYATLGVQTNSNLAASWGFSQGFDQYVFNYDAPADWVTSTGVSLAGSVTGPFFLYLHYNQPHVPYVPPVTYQTMMGYPDPVLPAAERLIVEDFGPYQVDYLRYYLGLQPSLTFDQLSPVGCDAVESMYDGDVKFTDDSLAILLNNILVTYPDTIVVVTADHGEHFWEHNSLGHTTTVYEQLIHVPLFIKAPGIPSASVDTLVNTLDLLPTLANLLGLPVRSHWEGRDMFGPRDAAGPVFASGKCRAPWLRDLEMIRLANMKLIREYKTGAMELYDLDSDIGELVNLAGAQPETCQELTLLLHIHLLNNARANGADSSITAFPGGLLAEGETVHLVASAGTGHVWFKDGVPLSDDLPHIEGSTTQEIILRGVTHDDVGFYECICADDLLRLNVTHPYILNVLSIDEMPVSNNVILFLLAVMVMLVAVYYVGVAKA